MRSHHIQRFIAALIASIAFISPWCAVATTLDDMQTTLHYALSAVAAVTADQPISCAILTSKNVVKVNETFTFAWYSTGKNSQIAPEGGLAWQPFNVISMAISKPGKWTYTLNFYGSGTVTPCSRIITVVP
ncbi:MAG: hypothetical protein UY67_C0001G0050 [Candidatus Kaiserbacteria bacterium GW2011_GWA2_52_12]|uniref:Ig-like domain-containing protein n=1 Tax=Candidatus Kaiserbacteria bacterium GW2011_GWA2_52_12 TaxID=1618671 RepID=A0A0G1X1R9_9BACT|nr:MAG: hypothetical protein UY67_C0001G0050 [Candidatus Kaiserbacteria bacterium GW2011_GWA2_52_12]